MRFRARCAGLADWIGELVGAQFGASSFEEGSALGGRDCQHIGQPLGDLAGWPPFIGLDFPDRTQGAANALRESVLSQVECFASAANPAAQRCVAIHLDLAFTSECCASRA